jgi:hypothetical protein
VAIYKFGVAPVFQINIYLFHKGFSFTRTKEQTSVHFLVQHYFLQFICTMMYLGRIQITEYLGSKTIQFLKFMCGNYVDKKGQISQNYTRRVHRSKMRKLRSGIWYLNTLRTINLVHNKFGYNNFGYDNFSHKFRNHLVYNNFSQIFDFSRPLLLLSSWFIAQVLAIFFKLYSPNSYFFFL